MYPSQDFREAYTGYVPLSGPQGGYNPGMVTSQDLREAITRASLVYPPCLTGDHTIPPFLRRFYAWITARMRLVVHTVRTVASMYTGGLTDLHF